jgi:hypothetical protein
MRSEDLFLFVGAGVSRPAPTRLLTFNEIRDAVLDDIGLNVYVEGSRSARKDLVDMAAGLVPERFLLALHQSGIPVEQWLGQALGHLRPNAAHRVLATLAANGAKVWTVNYDHNIEEANTAAGQVPLDVAAWPDSPRAASVLKPHGTLGGRLIATAEDVVRGLDERWLAQLRSDLSGRTTVVFLGYSGRDLDFHPYWNDLLGEADQVVWFDFPNRPAQEFKSRLLTDASSRGALIFPKPAAPPDAAISGISPCWDFIDWCLRERLIDAPPDGVAELFDSSKPDPAPRLTGDVAMARAGLLGALGSYREQRNDYLRLVWQPRHTAKALSALGAYELNHGGRSLAAALAAGRAIPPITARLRALRERAERKRVTALSKLGAHDRVLAITEHLPPDAPSTYLILRAGSLRATGSLVEAARVADEAFRGAVAEKHNVRIAHAAYQRCQALVWADEIAEARACLNDQLLPNAALAASRWVGWATFLNAAILVRDRDTTRARDEVELAISRFQGEALLDGIVSAQTVMLTVARLDGNDDEFRQRLGALRHRSTHPDPSLTYYTLNHPFTAQALQLEEAEFARTHVGDGNRAAVLYRALAQSQYPLYRAFGQLGSALLEPDGSRRSRYLASARSAADMVGQQQVAERCRLLAAGDSDAAGAEIFWC